MAGEENQVKWVGVRPTDPEESLPVKIGAEGFAIAPDERPGTYNNPSLVYSYDGNGRLQYIDMTIGAVTWRKTLAYDGSGRLDTESVWVVT